MKGRRPLGMVGSGDAALSGFGASEVSAGAAFGEGAEETAADGETEGIPSGEAGEPDGPGEIFGQGSGEGEAI